PGLTEAGMFGGDCDIADHVNDVAAADRDAIHRCDHRLRYVTDDIVESVDLPETVLAGAVAALLDIFLLVAASAERLVAGTGQDDGGDAAIGPGALEGVQQLLDRAPAKGVVPLRPVDGDGRDGAVDIVENVLIFHELGSPH